MGGSCRGWLPLQVPAFSKARRTLIYDHPGVGGSETLAGDFGTAELADTAAGLLDALQIERASVLGIFMGGMVAQQLALRHAERVSHLVLVGTYARPDARRRILLEQWRELVGLAPPVEMMVRERLLWTLADETLEQRDLIEAMTRFYSREAAPFISEVFARQCEACLRHDTTARLGEIRAPTLVLCGRDDRLTPPKLHRELAEGIPEARLATFPGAHLVLAESAEAVNRAVLQFLDAEE
jgi:pimeloyl-ACP methyl ester carboxylesterase